MRRFNIIVWRLLGVLTAAVLASPVAGASPAVVISSSQLTITGITPGGSVTLFGVARETGTWLTHVVVRRELLADDDHDGIIDYSPSGGVAFRSIWLVTDLATGETAIAAPAGNTPLPMTQRGVGRGNALNVTGNILDIGRENVQILVVRPKHGAWTISARTHGTEPAARRRLRVDVGKLTPLRAEFGAAPAALVPGDVVLVIDEERMEYSMTTVTPGGK